MAEKEQKKRPNPQLMMMFVAVVVNEYPELTRLCVSFVVNFVIVF
jgi:hypothetical protein